MSRFGFKLGEKVKLYRGRTKTTNRHGWICHEAVVVGFTPFMIKVSLQDNKVVRANPEHLEKIQ